MADISKYKFSKGFGGNSAGSFKAAVKNRYRKLSEKDLNALVEREFGKEPLEDGNSSPTKGKAAAPNE